MLSYGWLRELVDAKIVDAQRRVTELIALTAQLQEARHALSVEASAGPCGPDCACLVSLSRDRVLTVVPLTASEPAIACTLNRVEMVDRIADWQAVLSQVRDRSPVDGGIRLAFDAAACLPA